MTKKKAELTKPVSPADGTEEKPPPAPEDDEIEILEIEGMEEPGFPAAESPPPSAPGAEALRAELEALRRERDEIQERLLRKHADLENARKRLEREKEEFLRFAAARLVAGLLPVLDNLERALAVQPGPAAEGGIREGVRLVQQQFLDILISEGLEPFSPAGERFDPDRHEAVLSEERPDRPPEEVLEVLQQGYRFRGRLLRPARVKVAVPPADREPASPPSAPEAASPSGETGAGDAGGEAER
ncbi:MAG: nucleotide exchange factor GrpE [Acidobacteria bacterium]|nr:nucleotide exchange factor GrpE [Acidobacteriota bacterium]